MPPTQSSSRFALVRGNREPMIWPFRAEEEALEWALDHGCLDWDVQELGDQPEHAAHCGRCKEPWPCEHEQNDREARAFAMRLDRLCSHCGQEILPGSKQHQLRRSEVSHGQAPLPRLRQGPDVRERRVGRRRQAGTPSAAPAGGVMYRKWLAEAFASLAMRLDPEIFEPEGCDCCAPDDCGGGPDATHPHWDLTT